MTFPQCLLACFTGNLPLRKVGFYQEAAQKQTGLISQGKPAGEHDPEGEVILLSYEATKKHGFEMWLFRFTHAKIAFGLLKSKNFTSFTNANNSPKAA